MGATRSIVIRHSLLGLFVASVVLSVAGVPASAQDEPPALQRPAFKTLRFEEDWSSFPTDADEDFWDPVKRIKLNDDGSHWMSVGGELRVRAEYWNAFAFNDTSANEDTFVLGRALAHTDIHLGEGLRFFFEGKSAFYLDDRDLPGGRRSLDVDTGALQNAFVDLRLTSTDTGGLTARVGRQEFLYGKQRLASPLPWANTKRAWDGGRLIFTVDDWRIDGFYTRYAAVEKYDFNDWEPGPDFFGIYGAGKVGAESQFDLDLYWLGIDGTSATFNGSSGTETRHTFGARFGGDIGETNADFDMEGAFQVGEVGSADVFAWAFAATAGYDFADTDWSPRAYVGFDYASGDSDPGDGDVETFNQLFPLGHAYLGYMDFVGRQNIIDVSGGVSVKPVQNLTLKADLHLFWRADTDDALYNAGGGVVRSGAAGGDSEVGQEIDITATYRFDRHAALQAGYSHFFAGDFIDESGPDDDMDWLYAQVTYKF